LLAHDRWFYPGTLAFSTTKTGRHDIAEILLKVVQHQKSNQISLQVKWIIFRPYPKSRLFLVVIDISFVCLMVFNVTFNNISIISWLSVLLVEETGVPGENHRPDTDKLYHIILYTLPVSRFELTTSVVIGTTCHGLTNLNVYLK
jgi:hypothetical protein